MVKNSLKFCNFRIWIWISQKLLIWLAPKLACIYFIIRPYFTKNLGSLAQYGGRQGGATFLRKNGPKKIFFLAKIIFFWCIHSICRIDTSKYLFGRCLCKSWGKSAKYFGRYGLSKLPPQKEVILRRHFFGFFCVRSCF